MRNLGFYVAAALCIGTFAAFGWKGFWALMAVTAAIHVIYRIRNGYWLS